jgi:hypothetical protein
LLGISIAITLSDLAKEWNMKALADIGNALVFVIPAGILFAFVQLNHPSSPWLVISKVGVLVLCGVASIFVGYFVAEIPRLFSLDGSAPVPSSGEKSTRVKVRIELLVAIIGLCGALVGLVTETIRVVKH